MAEPLARIVLASASPRRCELLTQIGLLFTVAPSDIDETARPGEDPVAYVRRLAGEKAAAAPAEFGDVVIAADTTIDLDGQIIAKPGDEPDARRMLLLLSGRAHLVRTGVAVRRGNTIATGVETTIVTMVTITPQLLDWYLATGEPYGKAGAYAIQGAAALLVERVDGSVTNVIGLPLARLDALMTQLGLPLAAMLLPSGSLETPRRQSQGESW